MEMRLFSPMLRQRVVFLPLLLNTLFYPTVANANAYTITVQVNATSNVAAGGGNVIAYTQTGTRGWGHWVYSRYCSTVAPLD
jgi:hypothetical protein